MRRVRRSAAVLVATGLVCLGTSALLASGATAEAEPGSGLGSFALSANAPVLQARFDYAAQRCTADPAGTAGCEGVVNETVSRLSNGPVGYALSSIAWPGTLAGNLGSLLVTAGGSQVPPEASALNSPIRAEAHTGRKPVVTDYPPPPAPVVAHMTADAQATKVTATAALGGLQQPTVGSLGASSSRTVTELTGVSSARATAHSEVQDITIAGVLHIAAVESDAVATTDGAAAKASGRTVISGATVAGIPVSIDENGITVSTQSVPIPSQATDAVNTALSQSGITVALSKPHGTPSGGSVVYDAGVLAVVWPIQDGMTASVELGGAQVSVQATPGLGCLFNCGPGGVTGGTTGAVAPPPAITPPLGGPATGGDVAPPPTLGGPEPRVVQPVPQAFGGKLPHGLSPWLGGLAAAGAVLVMAGLRRLPDRVLAASSSSCPNGDLA
jgi:hypothetical protein